MISSRLLSAVSSPYRILPTLCRRNSTLSVTNPYSGEAEYLVPVISEAEALQAVDASARTQKAWQRTLLPERKQLVERFISSFDSGQAAIDISKQMGKPLGQAQGEVKGMIARALSLLQQADEALADDTFEDKHPFYRKIVKEPVGVVYVIAPWNYPLLTAINAIVPAVLAGNSVIIKHSPKTPLCGSHFSNAFEKAGGQGLVQSVFTTHQTSAKVINHPAVGFVSFTGSVRGGREVYQTIASSRFIDCTLELGGKDAGYVAEDADLAAAVDTLIDGACYNAGQSCCGIERIYVHQKHYKKFLEAAVEILNGYKLGDPLDSSTSLGPLALPDAPRFLQQQVDEAKKKGARVLTGGNMCHDASGRGNFFQPSLIADATHSMSLMMEESFGPIVGVSSVASDEEAVQKMNDSHYGLTAAIFTNDQERAARMARELQVGTVFMNRCDYLDPELPWGGHKDTGKGVSLSKHGFRGVTKLKAYHFKKLN